MKKALSHHVTPVLRNKGFVGDFPHFRRVANTKVDLLSFQFDKWGGGFVINVAVGPAEGFTTNWGEFIAVSKLSPYFDLGITARIQPGESGSRESWFRYDRSEPKNADIFETVAKEVVPYLEAAETWFAQFPIWAKPERPVPSKEVALRRRHLSIVARGLARHALESDILKELIDTGVSPNDVPDIYCRMVAQLNAKALRRPWWKFW